MLQIPKKKLLMARILMHGGLTCGILALIVWIFVDKGLVMLLALALCTAAIIGEQMIRTMYSCPVCGHRLLPHRYWGSLEDKCPRYCSDCGNEIAVELVDNDEH